MIKNIVFDMGNVMIRFEPEKYVAACNVSEEESKLLLDTIFDYKNWYHLDDGSMSEEEYYEDVRKKLPEHLHDAAFRLIMQWDQPLNIIEGMKELVEELKNHGKNIYLLSNASRRQHEYWNRVPAAPLFDGTVISADVGVIKPDRKIFEALFETYSLTPEECVFIDDLPANISAAVSLGMKGYIFDGDTEKLRTWLLSEDRENLD